MNKFLKLISIICCLVFLLSLTVAFTVFAEPEADAAPDAAPVDMIDDIENPEALPIDIDDFDAIQDMLSDDVGDNYGAPKSEQSVPSILTNLLYIFICFSLIVIVLLQSGRQAGLSGSIAGGAETFFGKNKGRTIDAILGKWTSACAILFMLIAIILNFILKA